VTVTDAMGRRYSLDLLADSSYDAAHLYLAEAKVNRDGMLPIPTHETVFEVVLDGTVYHVHGQRLQEWIVRRRRDLKGPKGFLFSQRPTLE
jgi:hypothetical protein